MSVNKQRPTVRDVARHAGVSVATVSRVTKDDPAVAAETRERVLASIAELDYAPSALGRALANRRFDTLGLVLPGLSGPYFADLMAGAESVTIDAGAAVSVLGTHLRAGSNVNVERLAARSDALVVVGGTLDDDEIARLAERLPVVITAGTSARVPVVRTDGQAAVRELVAHLVTEHRTERLCFAGLAHGSPDATARYSGFVQGLADFGLVEASAPIPGGLETTHGALAARELHAAGAVPQAIVCANDELAIGMLATLPGLGHRVPSDVIVCGFDDAPPAATVSPSLTTVHQPIFDLGAQAARLALDAVGKTPAAPRTITLPTSLVVRESCGCACD